VSDDVPAATKRRRREAIMKRQQRIVAARQAAMIGTDVAVMIDGPSPEHELVLQGRLEGQAPDIDPVVYLTDCDPTAFGRGRLIGARVVGSRGYDLVVSPVEVPAG
jgi:ribosomal protein S12 methylthiotransferase